MPKNSKGIAYPQQRPSFFEHVPDLFWLLLKVSAILIIILLAIFSVPLLSTPTLRRQLKHNQQGCEDFDLIKGDLTAPKRVILGEFHDQKQKTVTCLEHLTKNVKLHKVLLESVTAGKIVSCEKYGIPQKEGRTCGGWDVHHNDRYFKVYQEKIYYAKSFQELLKFYHSFPNKVTDPEIDVILSTTLLKSLGKISNNGQCENTNPLNCLEADELQALKLITEILNFREQGLSYSEIFSSINSDPDKITEEVYEITVDIHDKDLIENMKLRNKSLMNELLKHHGLFTIAIAGQGHVFDRGDEFSEAARYVQEELEKDQHQNPYAILALSSNS